MSGITSSVLNIGRNALQSYELAMQVTTHNIANALTPRYTRQQIALESQDPLNLAGLQLGMGVKAGSVGRAFDPYTARSIQQNTSALAENEAKATALSYLETIFNEASGQGLNQAMTELWNAWQDLAGTPGGIAERTALLQKADALATQFRSMSAELNQVGQSMNTNLGASIRKAAAVTKALHLAGQSNCAINAARNWPGRGCCSGKVHALGRIKTSHRIRIRFAGLR